MQGVFYPCMGKRREKPKISLALCYVHHLELNSSLLNLCRHTVQYMETKTHQDRFIDTSMGIIQSSLTKCSGIVFISGACSCGCCGLLFVPDLDIFGRSVDSNKGLLNNRFHSLTQERLAWPSGESCSFEHINPGHSIWLPFVIHC